MKILQILSSAKGENSVSTKLANAIVEKLKAANPGSTVVVKDLAALQPPHLYPVIVGAFFTPKENLTPEQTKAIAFSDLAIKDIFDADVIVIGAAFYNYSVSSSLKAWIDNVCRSKITFYYNEKGIPIGMVPTKPVYVGIASGGIYRENPAKESDFVKPYLSTVLASIGLTDVRFFLADGANVPGVRDTALQNAIDSIVL
jgi:FMN-dependent NADH-azoreductase